MNTKELIKCPACANIMKKAEINNIIIDICDDGCGGIWFDAIEFKKITKDSSLLKLLTDCSIKILETVNPQENKTCPVCNVPMVTHNYNINSDCRIEECYTCGGRFLDGNEIVQIQNNITYNETHNKIDDRMLSEQAQEIYENNRIK